MPTKKSKLGSTTKRRSARKPVCKINRKAKRRVASVKAWEKAKKQRGSFNDPVGALPPPPPPAPHPAADCFDEWADALTDAQALKAAQDYLASMLAVQQQAKALPPSPNKTALLAQLATLIAAQTQVVRLKTNALTQQVAAYLGCVQGEQA